MVWAGTSISVKVCAVFCATTFAIVAAETSPSLPADPLAAAKRDYEAFKAGGIQVSPPDGLNLRHSLPALETMADAPPTPSPIQRARRVESVRAQKRAARSENWLIEAVRNNSESSPARVGFRRGDDVNDEQSVSAFEDFLYDDSTSAGVSERGSGRAHEVGSTQKISADRSAETYNPLDSYMSKWMTPSDFERLKSQPNDAGPAGSSGGALSLHPLTSVPFSPLVAPMRLNGEIGFDEHSARFDSKNDNPYLADFAMPAAPVLSLSAPELPKRVSPNLMPSMPEPSATTRSLAAPPAKPSRPEGLKTGDEGKFFKQLKRF